MRKLILFAGAAALAASMPAIAEKGGKGGGNGGGGKPAAAQGHGGGGHGGGKPAKAHGGGHGGGQAAKAHGGGHGGGQAKAQRFERQSFGGGRKPDKAVRQMARGGGGKPDKAVRQAARGPERSFKAERKAVKQAAKQERRVVEQLHDGRFDGRRSDDRNAQGGFARFADYGAACPPGLAKKNNGCLPPGQAKKVFGLGDRIQPQYFGGYNVPQEYRAFYQDTGDYRYRYDDDGYIYRIDNGSGLISGLVPLLGGGFAVGQPLPAGYDVYNLPQQYRDNYYDTDDSYYRYGDDAIYRVDPQSGMIESIVALLAGDLNVGQALPSGYDAYNLPLDYRDEYQDNADYNYRYADGNIYQVDTKTQIIQAIVEMLV